MLWTDGLFVSVNDLLQIDSEVEDVAEAEEISISGRYGAIATAITEATQPLHEMLVAFGGYLGGGDVSPNHIAAVMNVGLGSAVRYRALPNQIVVSGETDLVWGHMRKWVSHLALSIIYRNANNRTVKDRYESKMRAYKSEINRSILPAVRQLGIPLVIRPLSAPGALFERNSGDWDESNVGTTAGSGTLDDQVVEVAVTFVDMTDASLYVSSTVKHNAESAGSDKIKVMLTTGNVVTVDISSLNPPDGTQPRSLQIMCVMAPLTATHWNVYVGKSGKNLYLQNGTPIPIATKVHTLSGDPTFSGSILDSGQYQERRISISNLRQRS